MKKLLNILLSGLLLSNVSGQGCSDAGFCSLGALKNISANQSSKQVLDIGSTVGIGEQNTFTINPYVQYTLQVSQRFSLAGKLTATYANGFLGTTFNAGDFYGVATYAFKKTIPASIRLLAGIKLPFTYANTKNAQGKPLPLDYQSSIGTYDVIAGINYIANNKLELDAGTGTSYTGEQKHILPG